MEDHLRGADTFRQRITVFFTPHLSSRGYQNIKLERIITMTREIVKGLKSGRRWAWKTWKEWARVERRSSKKRKQNQYNSICSFDNRPLGAPESLSKCFQSQPTNLTSIHKPVLIIIHNCLTLSLFISFSAPSSSNTHSSPPNLTPQLCWGLPVMLLTLQGVWSILGTRLQSRRL